jgi:hypothetical protein
MEKTEFKSVKMVETIAVLPRTLEIKAENTRQSEDVEATMAVVYGRDAADRKVWCATFVDTQEAEAWVHSSKMFGRPVLGAVLAGQGNLVQSEAQKGAEMSDGAVAVGTEPDATNPS